VSACRSVRTPDPAAVPAGHQSRVGSVGETRCTAPEIACCLRLALRRLLAGRQTAGVRRRCRERPGAEPERAPHQERSPSGLRSWPEPGASEAPQPFPPSRARARALRPPTRKAKEGSLPPPRRGRGFALRLSRPQRILFSEFVHVKAPCTTVRGRVRGEGCPSAGCGGRRERLPACGRGTQLSRRSPRRGARARKRSAR
jgi:hypothetical protein